MLTTQFTRTVPTVQSPAAITTPHPHAHPRAWQSAFLPQHHPDLAVHDGEPRHGDYLERLLQVLEFIARQGRPLRLSQICAELNLPMTTVHRLLITLWNAGLLHRDIKRRYTPGTRLVALLNHQPDEPIAS
ncbi:helix-turn-helix domain-containing protein [Saccharothrix sp. NPDC042600]|uniref:helix-turn-helix domain-containing protein n=1 Tax=Saccharothrix TaxID=2071 RepID=UPI0033FC568C|nr:hypothetical protein GCM10017745_67700 [Saccharothrix mutabilis subsp. capreolus]